MTLDDLLRDAAKRGELNHISLFPHAKGFLATYCKASKCTHTTAVHADPAEAIKAALMVGKRRSSTDIDFG